MKKLISLGVCLIVGIELLSLIAHDRRFVLGASGVALALVLLSVRRVLGHGTRSAPEPDPDDLGDSLRRWRARGSGRPSAPEPDPDDLGDSLRRWLSTTETTIRWSESTRSDWDRHLRPMLARRYEMATGQKQAKDPAAFHSTGQMLFGDELWDWVNPNNVARNGDRQPGPGRATLEEILRRLEQV